MKKKGIGGRKGLLVYKNLNFSDFVFIESSSTIVPMKITFSNLKSAKCFEFNKKNFWKQRTLMQKIDFNYFLSKNKKSANFEYEQNKDMHTKPSKSNLVVIVKACIQNYKLNQINFKNFCICCI